MSAEANKSEWTSLEIAKLAVPIVASVILAIVGLRISEQLDASKAESAQYYKSIDSMVQKRLILYDQIGGRLNEEFTYFMYVGKWKQLSPEDIVKDKRDLDEIIFTYQPFFSATFVAMYRSLEDSFFRPFTGWGKDAMLRTSVSHRKEFFAPTDKTLAWNSEWDSRFTGEDNTVAVRTAYSALISALPGELGIPELSVQGVRPIPLDQVAKPNLPPATD